MTKFIDIECITINALAELAKKNICEVSFETLVRYGAAVCRIYKQMTGDDAIALMSRRDQRAMLDSCAKFLDGEFSANCLQCVRLKNGASIETLDDFRNSMSVRMYQAFTAPDALFELSIEA